MPAKKASPAKAKKAPQQSSQQPEDHAQKAKAVEKPQLQQSASAREPQSVISASIDFAICALVASNSMGRLWEQDAWWQLRLGDEILFQGKGFPQTEEWTYTSSHVPFHNHWWLFTIGFSLLYHYGGGVAGFVALRGVMCGLLAKLVLMIRPYQPERWLLAALSFRISKHRLQCRPEVLCLDVFCALPVVRNRLESADLRRAQSGKSCILWPKEVLLMYAGVVAAANMHFGVVPWPVLCCGALLADDLFDTKAVAAKVWSWLPWINLTALARAAPVIFLVFINPQPLAGLGYILHHRPGKYMVDKKLKNPEHRSFMDEMQEYLQNDKWRWFSNSQLKHVPWICVFFALAVLVPVLWFLQGREKRPAGLRSPLFVMLAHGMMTYLVYDRTRTVVWPICFMAAMLGSLATSSESQEQRAASKRQWKAYLQSLLRHYVWPAVCLILSVVMIAGDFEVPSFKMAGYTWPVRTTEWVRSRNLTGNVYHTITFGGYLAYWLPDNKHFADPREYCFRHLDELYAAVHLDAVRLNKDILEKYDIDIFIALIPQTRQLPMGGFDDVAGRFLDSKVWARVFFDHTSEVFLRRTVPEFRDLIAEKEMHAMIPAFPPDYHVRVLLGRERGNLRGLQKDLEVCLARKEVYCELIDALYASATANNNNFDECVKWLQVLESKDPQDLKDERVMTRQYLESTRIHLRKQLGLPPPARTMTPN